MIKDWRINWLSSLILGITVPTGSQAFLTALIHVFAAQLQLRGKNMATFSQRNDRWRAKALCKNFAAQSKSFSTKGDGQMWAVSSKHDDGTWGDQAGATDITFGKLLVRYKESVTKTKRIRRSKEYRIGKIKRHKIAGYSIRNLMTGVLADFRGRLLKVANNSCGCRELATISAAITHAQR